jgi:hypothetical protein
MTLIVGIKCKDGLVVAADGATTWGVPGELMVRQSVRKKLRLLGTWGVVGVSGTVGMGQRLAAEVEALRDVMPGHRPHEVMTAVRQALWQVLGAELDYAKVAALAIGDQSSVLNVLAESVAGLVVGGEPCLFYFNRQGMPGQVCDEVPFVSAGCGKWIADPFLAYLRRTYWRGAAPDLAQGAFSAVWSLHYAIRTHPGGFDLPLQVVAFRRGADGVWKAEEMPEAEWRGHLELVKRLEAELSNLQQKLLAAEGTLY